MLNKINIFGFILICSSCANKNYTGLYTRPQSTKVLADVYILNQDSSYESLLTSIDYDISTFGRKGKYIVLKNKFIVLNPDSTKEMYNMPYKVIDIKSQQYYNSDTFSIITKDQEFLLEGNGRCYMKQKNNKPLNKDKYYKLCKGASTTRKHGH